MKIPSYMSMFLEYYKWVKNTTFFFSANAFLRTTETMSIFSKNRLAIADYILTVKNQSFRKKIKCYLDVYQ